MGSRYPRRTYRRDRPPTKPIENCDGCPICAENEGSLDEATNLREPSAAPDSSATQEDA